MKYTVFPQDYIFVLNFDLKIKFGAKIFTISAIFFFGNCKT